MVKLSFISIINPFVFLAMTGMAVHDQAIGNPVYPASERSQGMLTIFYDNNPCDYRLKSSWGFSCLIELEEKTILFDTGGDGEILLYNMRVLNKDPKTIDIAVLSHIHGDHTGGLWSILQEKPTLKVYIPKSFPEEFGERVEKCGAKVFRVASSLTILPGVCSTGELGHGIKEQSLLIDSRKGLILITGCAHPGIVEIIKKAKTIAGRDIYRVTGGWHLSSAGEREIKGIIKAFLGMGIQRVAPCHCTGDKAMAMFKSEYGEHFVKAGVGRIIKF